jgi:hypothetical protein
LEYSPDCPLDRKLVRTQKWSGRSGEERDLAYITVMNLLSKESFDSITKRLLIKQQAISVFNIVP